ncbi:MAG: restriction endonuclease subunit S, partial [Alistipes sp.]|nr:restriction endonuclease subunit S [Alistipes sp.]
MNGKQLKNSILQWAIQGKLVPQDPNDEPASVLLERIREEKARLVKEKKIKKDKNESIIFRGDDNSHYEKFADGTVKCIDDEIPFEIPQSWCWTRICNITQSYIGLTYSPSEVSSQGTIVLRSSNIKNGRLDLCDIVRVSKEIPEKLRVAPNDIIICARNGSKRLVGKSAIVDTVNEPMTFGAFMAICKTPLYKYIYQFLQSDLFFSQLRDVSGTTTINQLTQNNFNAFLVSIPPIEEQQRIVERIEEIMPIADKYEKSQEALDKLNAEIFDKLKKSVLQEAIQGKLVPQDPNDEPASVLLERIKEEKAKLFKEGKLKKKDLVDSVIFKGEDNKY